MEVYKKLKTYLEENLISFKEIEHAPAKTCKESAQFRGTKIEVGGKTALFKSRHGFHLFVISAALEIDSKKVRKIVGSSWLRFAKPDEFKKLTGVIPGSLPPFGKPIFDFDIYLDESINDNSEIAFNAGVPTKSFILNTKDYLKLIDPKEFYKFSKK